jgi:hypothetical protein
MNIPKQETDAQLVARVALFARQRVAPGQVDPQVMVLTREECRVLTATKTTDKE